MRIPRAYASRWLVCADPVDVIAENLVTGYRNWRGGRVVTRASFSIPAGMVVALVGPNGSGKTTLIRTLVGLLSPREGSVRVGQSEPTAYRNRCGVGYLPEALQLPESWTGRGLLLLAAQGAGRAGLDSLDAALHTACVDFDVRQPIGRLSKGMRQRLALALLLIPRPNLIVLDEPEAGLDPAQRIALRTRLRDLSVEGCTVIIASHDVTALGAIAGRSYLFVDTMLKELTM